MKIVIVNGGASALYVIDMFRKSGNKIIVINSERERAEEIMTQTHLSVYVGSPWRRFVLEEAGVKDADIFISLCDVDTDNYAACMMAKDLFGVKKTICTVKNPNNVELYKELGIDSAISSTYLLAQSIRSESSAESLIKTLSFDEDRIMVLEATVLSKYAICNKRIMDIHFPKYASIAAVNRHYQVIIPNGQTLIEAKDRLLIVTTPDKRDDIMRFVQKIDE